MKAAESVTKMTSAQIKPSHAPAFGPETDAPMTIGISASEIANGIPAIRAKRLRICNMTTSAERSAVSTSALVFTVFSFINKTSKLLFKLIQRIYLYHPIK